MAKRRPNLPPDAPTPRVGVCYVCGGKVTEEVYYKPPVHNPDVVPGDPTYRPLLAGKWTTGGLHCLNCGVKYQKLPPLRTRDD